MRAVVALLAVALAGSLAAAGPAAATPESSTFPGGSLTGLKVDSSFTSGSIGNFTYRFEGCGKDPAEATCTWQVRLTLHSNPQSRCAAATPDSEVLWDSGERSGNGSVESGPLSFTLEGCKGQALGGTVEHRLTYDPDKQEGGWKSIVSGGAMSLFAIGIGAETVAGLSQRIIDANTAAKPPAPVLRPQLSVSADCRSLTIGNARYAFAYKRIGCYKATNLARMLHISGSAPSGYHCRREAAGGMRCWRKGQPKKYVEWRVPKAKIQRI